MHILQHLGQSAHMHGSLYQVGPPLTPIAEKINRYNNRLLGEVVPQLLRRGHQMIDIDFFCAEAMIAFIDKEVDYRTQVAKITNATDDLLNQLYDQIHKDIRNGTR